MRWNITMVIGVITAMFGWVFLLFGTSINGFDDVPLFNFHSGAVSQQFCFLGYTLLIVGAVQSIARAATVTAGSHASLVDQGEPQLVGSSLEDQQAKARVELQLRTGMR